MNPLHVARSDERLWNSDVSGQNEQERLLYVTNLRHKLQGAHALLVDIWRKMLDNGGITRSALLAWVALLLLGNWGRTRLMRSQRDRTTSTDEFLMSLCLYMMECVDMGTTPAFEPDVFLRHSRLDLGDQETRLHLPAAQARQQVSELIVPDQSDDDQAFMRLSMHNDHSGIICKSPGDAYAVCTWLTLKYLLDRR